VQIPRKIVSAELSFAHHGTETSKYDRNILFYHHMKYQVTWHTRIRDTKKSVNLRDILQIASMQIESPISSQFSFAELQATVLIKLKQGVHECDSPTPQSLPTYPGGVQHPQGSEKPQHCSGSP
jgi:hypothetical protein